MMDGNQKFSLFLEADSLYDRLLRVWRQAWFAGDHDRMARTKRAMKKAGVRADRRLDKWVIAAHRPGGVR